MGTADVIILAAGAYIALGLVFAVPFVTIGVGRLDPAARRGAGGAPWSFRLLILPGAAALWPFLLLKWIRATRSGPAGGHTP